MSNVHPWFANQSATNAAGWTAEFFQTTNVAPSRALSNTPQMFIAETGWPTVSNIINIIYLLNECWHMVLSNHPMQATLTTVLPQHRKLPFRPSWILLSAKQTQTVQDTSFLRYAFRHEFAFSVDVAVSYSISMSPGKMHNSEVLRDGGVFSTPSELIPFMLRSSIWQSS